jgi:hypothetical protein
MILFTWTYLEKEHLEELENASYKTKQKSVLTIDISLCIQKEINPLMNQTTLHLKKICLHPLTRLMPRSNLDKR